VRRAALVLSLLCSAGARAATNDLQLWRLGSPDNITVCTICTGADNVPVPGDASAQFRFARLTATLALAFAPAFEDQAQTTGQAGFEMGGGVQVAFPKLAPQEWPSEGTLGAGSPPQALFLPTVALRKGLGGSVELGAAVTWLTGSQMLGVGGQIRWAPIEGLYGRPGFMIRRAHQIAVSIFLEETGELGITNRQYGILLVLKQQPGIDQISVAKLLGLDRSTTGMVLAKLEESGLVERCVGARDRRRRSLQLTRAGEKMLERLIEPARRAQARVLSAFTPPERAQFLALLDKFIRKFSESTRVPLEAHRASMRIAAGAKR